jgi:hypothetical protein
MRRILGIRTSLLWAILLAVPCCGVRCGGQDAGTPAQEEKAKVSPVEKYQAAGYVNDFAELIDPKARLFAGAV